jgi:hypothetical protein
MKTTKARIKTIDQVHLRNHALRNWCALQNCKAAAGKIKNKAVKAEITAPVTVMTSFR